MIFCGENLIKKEKSGALQIDFLLLKKEILKFDYNVIKEGELIARIYAEASIVNDKYVIEGKDEDIPFLIALTIALDNINDKILK